MFIFSFLVLVFQIDGMLFTKLKYLKKNQSQVNYIFLLIVKMDKYICLYHYKCLYNELNSILIQIRVENCFFLSATLMS